MTHVMLTSIGIDLLFAAVSFGVLWHLYRPLEVAQPAWPDQPLMRPGWWTDLLFFLGQHLIWLTLVMNLVFDLSPWLHGLVPPELRRVVGLQPGWLQLIEVVVLGDLLMYWGHRLQHRVELLWRFHSVHHTAEHLDWLASHREHPVDTVYSVLLMNLPAYMLGFTPDALVFVIAFRGAWSILIHSNVRMELGIFGLILGSPSFHHWHHDRKRHSCNFGNVSPWLDVIFGTHHDPRREPRRLGVEEPAATGYLGLLLNPFLPERFQIDLRLDAKARAR